LTLGVPEGNRLSTVAPQVHRPGHRDAWQLAEDSDVMRPPVPAADHCDRPSDLGRPEKAGRCILGPAERPGMMPAIFAAIACFFVAAERLSPVRSQPLLRRGFFTDVVYVAIHYCMRVTVNGTVAVALVEMGRRVLPPEVVVGRGNRPLW